MSDDPAAFIAALGRFMVRFCEDFRMGLIAGFDKLWYG